MTSLDTRSVDMIRRLVAFPTVSRDSNLDLIEFVRNYLTDFGIECDLTYDDAGGKANLFATIGPSDRSGIMLSGHTDVVPVDGQDWDSDPFRLVEHDERLHGRGAADMKGFIGIVLAKVPDMVERTLRTPIHLAFSYDEEVGCLGVRRLIARFDDLPIRPAACIVGEPTGMKPVIGHKGKLSVRCHVHGKEGHSSLPGQAVNAVEAAAEAVTYLKGMARRFAAEGPFDGDYDPPHTTVHTGVIQGGTALNIVPNHCSFDFEFRYLPGTDPDALLDSVRGFVETRIEPEMRAIDPATGFRFDEIAALPALNLAEDDPLTSLVKALSGANGTGKVSFGTEGGLFQAKGGIPTIVCGPGSIEQAHKPNEFVSRDQIARCEAFLDRLIEHASAARGAYP